MVASYLMETICRKDRTFSAIFIKIFNSVKFEPSFKKHNNILSLFLLIKNPGPE